MLGEEINLCSFLNDFFKNIQPNSFKLFKNWAVMLKANSSSFIKLQLDKKSAFGAGSKFWM